MAAGLNKNLNTSGPESALLLERVVPLAPGERRTLYFLYGYLPAGFDLASLGSEICDGAGLVVVAIQ